jgi:hypothetical protein
VAEDQDRIARDEEDWHAARKRLAFLEIQIHTSAGTVTRLEGGMRAMMKTVSLENLALHVHKNHASGEVTFAGSCTLHPQIVEKFGRRLHAGDQQVISRAGTRNVE